MTEFFTLRFHEGGQVLYAAHNDGAPIVWRLTPNPEEACRFRRLIIIRRLLRGPRVFRRSTWEVVRGNTP